jgi:hypothetical protein
MTSTAENEKNKIRIKEDFRTTQASITALIGLSKNAGKTSFLNWLSAHLEITQAGIITTGRDGEDFDLVSKQKKPKVYIPATFFFTTWEHQISANAPYLEIVEKLSLKAAGKPLWLVKATHPLQTEVVGPATVSQQIQLAKKILSFGAKHVFIDGSLDRKSVVLAKELEQFFLIVSPAFGALPEIIKETERIVTLISIPLKQEMELFPTITYHTGEKCVKTNYKSLLGNEKEAISEISTEKKVSWLFLPGVITNRMFRFLEQLIKKTKCAIFIEHPFQSQLSYHFLQKLAGQIFVKRQSRLCGIATNSFSANGNHLDSQILLEEMQKRFSQIPVVDAHSL